MGSFKFDDLLKISMTAFQPQRKSLLSFGFLIFGISLFLLVPVTVFVSFLLGFEKGLRFDVFCPTRPKAPAPGDPSRTQRRCPEPLTRSVQTPRARSGGVFCFKESVF